MALTIYENKGANPPPTTVDRRLYMNAARDNPLAERPPAARSGCSSTVALGCAPFSLLVITIVPSRTAVLQAGTSLGIIDTSPELGSLEPVSIRHIRQLPPTESAGCQQ